MSFFADLAKGGVEGLATGIGTMAKDLRAAFTGKEVLTSEQMAAQLERLDALEAAAQKLEGDVRLGQVEINKIDAASGSLYKGGWRPFLGWVCAVACGYQFLLRLILPWLIQVTCLLTASAVVIPEMPALEMQTLITLLGALLGFGTMRTVERVKGTV